MAWLDGLGFRCLHTRGLSGDALVSGAVAAWVHRVDRLLASVYVLWIGRLNHNSTHFQRKELEKYSCNGVALQNFILLPF